VRKWGGFRNDFCARQRFKSLASAAISRRNRPCIPGSDSYCPPRLSAACADVHLG
jgi:hypothetical protein